MHPRLLCSSRSAPLLAGYGVCHEGHTTFINCSSCTARYEPVNLPIVFDLPARLGARGESSQPSNVAAAEHC